MLCEVPPAPALTGPTGTPDMPLVPLGLPGAPGWLTWPPVMVVPGGRLIGGGQETMKTLCLALPCPVGGCCEIDQLTCWMVSNHQYLVSRQCLELLRCVVT